MSVSPVVLKDSDMFLDVTVEMNAVCHSYCSDLNPTPSGPLGIMVKVLYWQSLNPGLRSSRGYRPPKFATLVSQVKWCSEAIREVCTHEGHDIEKCGDTLSQGKVVM